MIPSKPFATSAIVALTILLTTASAMAQDTPDKLIKYAPKNTGFLVGLDVKVAKKTMIGQELIKKLLSDKKVKRSIAKLEKAAKFNIKKDLDSLVFSGPSPIGKGKNIGKTATIILSGTFDKKHIDSIMATTKLDKSKLGALTIVSPEKNVDFALINKSTFVVILGPKAYRSSSWQTVIGKGLNVTKHPGMSKMLRTTNTKKPAFLLINARKMTQPKGPKVKSGILELGLKSGLNINARMMMNNATDAKQAITDMEASKLSGKAVLSMVSATSLIDNLKMKQKGAQITMTSFMTKAEVGTAIKAIKSQTNKPKTTSSSEKK